MIDLEIIILCIELEQLINSASLCTTTFLRNKLITRRYYYPERKHLANAVAFAVTHTHLKCYSRSLHSYEQYGGV